LIQSLPSSWGLSPYRDAIVFILLIAFLLFRPGGLVGVKREVKL
jgi:branched-chain amino acid transport system permease protein